MILKIDDIVMVDKRKRCNLFYFIVVVRDVFYEG
jgi:hypothetical protein